MTYKRVDANQNATVASLRSHGAIVHVTSMLGHGFPDLIALVGRILVMIEIKDGSKPPSQQKLTPDEQKFHDKWGCVEIIRSLEDVEKLIEKYSRMS